MLLRTTKINSKPYRVAVRRCGRPDGRKVFEKIQVVKCVHCNCCLAVRREAETGWNNLTRDKADEAHLMKMATATANKPRCTPAASLYLNVSILVT